MAEPNAGDTPLTEGVQLYEPTHEEVFVQSEGDRPVEGEVHLVEGTGLGAPTARQLRELGYVVPSQLDDEERVYDVVADQPLEAGKVNLYVEQPAYPGGPAPEEPEIKLVDGGGPPEAVSDPSSEENAARSDEERAVAEEASDKLRDATDANYQAGRQARANGEPRSANPNDARTREGKVWVRGWDSVEGA
ncbi:MAG: hypothetical protein DLM66_14810 [Candidatus Dormiibacter spiritus]|nr:MAG: hypothetical protein DLM66_14810 [Candidatus Dormibacteraeota bacterium]